MHKVYKYEPLQSALPQSHAAWLLTVYAITLSFSITSAPQKSLRIRHFTLWHTVHYFPYQGMHFHYCPHVIPTRTALMSLVCQDTVSMESFKATTCITIAVLGSTSWILWHWKLPRAEKQCPLPYCWYSNATQAFARHPRNREFLTNSRSSFQTCDKGWKSRIAVWKIDLKFLPAASICIYSCTKQ